MFNILQNVIEGLLVTGVFHWECMAEWLPCKLWYRLSACLDAQKAISSLLNTVLVSSMQRSNSEKEIVFNYLHNGVEPKHTTLRMLNWGSLSIF